MVLDREFPPDIRVENEIDALVSAGHEVHIACYTQKGKPLLESTGKFTIHRKPISHFRYRSSAASLTLPFYFCYWRKFLRQLLQVNDFEVLHVHDLPLVGVGGRLKKEFRLKLVADLHENWPAFLDISEHTRTVVGRLLSPIFLWRKYEKKILHKVDAIIVVVQEAKDRLVELDLDPGKIKVVSNTINLAEVNLSPVVVTRQHQILYYAGGINYHRGLQHVIQAMHKSNNSRLVFWILGEGSYKNRLMALTRQLSLTDRVIFYGYQPFTRVMEMLSESDFALIPHIKTEHTDSTIPHKLFQYMYAQKPVIASNCLPIERILLETGAGLVFPSGNLDFLSDLFIHLEKLHYSDMAEKGRKAVLDKYNWKNDADALLQLYDNLFPNRQI
jgi:glycosyltransferase involved in cell wall biosynthesis